MNIYLTKIAEMKLSKDTRPYRDRVEIVIRKGDKFLVTKNRNPDNGDTWSGFPGGGTDKLTDKEACRNECLEEVGVAIKNITYLGIEYKQEGGLSKKQGRNLKYRGSITRWYVAEYDSMDSSKLGDDGDSRKYSWKTLQEALGDFKMSGAIGRYRAAAIKASTAS